jgi:GT2 family glycosyltransferase
MANGKYILMLNPDTLVIKKSIQTLMNVLDKNPRIGLVGPRIIDSRGLIDTAYKWYPPCLWGIFLERFRIRKIITLLVSLGGLCNTSYYKRWHRSRYVPFILGACMLFRKAELNRIGYLDERLPMFLDDIDLCHRFLKEGFNIYHCAEAEIVHLGGASLKKSEHRLLLGTMMLQGIDMFFAKYKSKTFIIIYHFILLISSLVLISFNLLMFPLLAISRRDISFIIKGHFRTLLYSISFKMNVPNENPSLI